MGKFIGAIATLALVAAGALSGATVAAADDGTAGGQCVATPARTVVTDHPAVTHQEFRWVQQVPAVEEVSHPESRFYRDVEAASHAERQFIRTNPGQAETTHQEYTYERTVPGTDGVRECVWTKTVDVTETRWQYAKFTQTKTWIGEVWATFQPTRSHKPFVGPPEYPNDDRGKWTVKDKIPDGQEGPDGVYQKGGGHGDWFYRQAGAWSAYGPWTLWTPLSHEQWLPDSGESIGEPAFHGQGHGWYRQWQVRKTGESKPVKVGTKQTFTPYLTEAEAATLDRGWTKTDDCKWRVEPVAPTTEQYNDGKWTTDIPGDGWTETGRKSVGDGNGVAPFPEYKTTGGVTTDPAQAQWFTDGSFDGWGVWATRTVQDKAGFREYKTADGTTQHLGDAQWFTDAVFDGWTVLDGRKVVDQEAAAAYPIYYLDGGNPTLTLGDENWTKVDPGQPWTLVDERKVVDAEAYSTKKQTKAVYGECLAYTGAADWMPPVLIGVGAILAGLVIGMVLKRRKS